MRYLLFGVLVSVPVLGIAASGCNRRPQASPPAVVNASHRIDDADALAQKELEALRDAIVGDVEDLRGLDFTGPVAVRVTTKEQFVEYVREREDRFQPAAERKASETVAKLLGLVPADMDLEETMLGFMR